MTRVGEPEILDMLKVVNDPSSSFEVGIERAFLAELGGGCKVPVAAYAKRDGAGIEVSAMAATIDGCNVFRTSIRVDDWDFVDAGRRVARQLLDSGACKII